MAIESDAVASARSARGDLAVGYAATKPSGGLIEEVDHWDGRRLFWQIPKGGVGRYFAAVFLGCWLCGWAVGWVVVVWQLFDGQNIDTGGRLFLGVWLCGWTVGGGAAIWTLWTMLRPGRPESVTLGDDHLDYDPGTTPVNLFMQSRMRFWSGQVPDWPTLPRIKTPIRVAKTAIRKFGIDRVGERQRLSFDQGAKRVEIGVCLDEPEREWLQMTLEAWRLG